VGCISWAGVSCWVVSLIRLHRLFFCPWDLGLHSRFGELASLEKMLTNGGNGDASGTSKVGEKAYLLTPSCTCHNCPFTMEIRLGMHLRDLRRSRRANVDLGHLSRPNHWPLLALYHALMIHQKQQAASRTRVPLGASSLCGPANDDTTLLLGENTEEV
jgi:hypothetical protein